MRDYQIVDLQIGKKIRCEGKEMQYFTANYFIFFYRNFIRTDQPSASVEICLLNRGEEAYKKVFLMASNHVVL